MTTSRTILLGTIFTALACSSQERPAPKTAAPHAVGGGPVAAASDDEAACAQICEASVACGDSAEECAHKCNAWLVKRSRAGIARQTATCAVPRIESACASDAAQGAAKALVLCVDDAGRGALKSDNHSLLVAVRAICDRGARCGGGSASDATECTNRLMSATPTPRGLGIFGAIRPEIVNDFATCMESTSCEGSPAVCFAGMMGEEVMEEPESPAKGTSAAPGTKI